MILRRATAEDLPALRDIAERAYSVYVERIGRRPRPMDDDYDERLRRARVFVADDGGVVVGLIVLIATPDHVLVENVAVDPAHQRAGIGRALLSLAEEYAGELGVDRLRLYTNVTMIENIRLYTRLGYEEDGRHIGDGFARVHMSKRVRTRRPRDARE
ncbi:MAG TPA: GNAT family N-acetyltransferase [Thermoanaerobaculaceae bacterium]|nr:GNAT family N-acetyltransferase [Thermoanaerobaculaceae bacterium]